MKLPRHEPERARIEIIPMIDTIFFLLVFFMMSSLSMVHSNGHPVDLPQSATARSRADEKIVLSVSREGDYYIDRRRVAFPDILPRLAERVKRDHRVVVVINCDRAQPVGRLQGVIDVVKQANPASLMIATAPRAGERR